MYEKEALLFIFEVYPFTYMSGFDILYDFFLFGGVGGKKILRNTIGGVMPNAYFWLQGGEGGGQKFQKPAYVIHGCSL